MYPQHTSAFQHMPRPQFASVPAAQTDPGFALGLGSALDPGSPGSDPAFGPGPGPGSAPASGPGSAPAFGLGPGSADSTDNNQQPGRHCARPCSEAPGSALRELHQTEKRSHVRRLVAICFVAESLRVIGKNP